MKSALVTGAARRLGRHLAEGLAEIGYFVWIHYRHSQPQAESVLSAIRKRGGDGALIGADVSKRAEVETMARELGAHSPALDVLVHNVGEYSTGDLLEYPPEEFERLVRTNLLGSYYVLHYFAGLLAPGGRVIQIGYAGARERTATTNATAYTLTKAAQHILTRSYALALGPKGICINTVSLGQQENSVDLPADIARAIPLGRAGTDADVVNLIRFLVGPGGDFITGQDISVSGGYLLDSATRPAAID